jgi:4-amino-4-deoxy-L-arabinose transferase-like glycosyltransferase
VKRNLAAVAVAAAVVAALLGLRAAVVDDPLSRLREVESGVYEGSWHFPRGGPYVLGFEGGVALHVDGNKLRTRPHPRDAKFVNARVVFEPGVYSVRFETRPGGRLLWHPPGRRGPAEYVPPSSLSPEPPERAEFGSWAGASPLDGVFAALICAALLGLALYLLRDRIRRIDRRVAAAVGAVFALALLVRLIGLNAAGQTWDEDVNWSAGRNYVTNLLSLDFRQTSWRFNFQHPPVMKYIAGIGAQFSDGYGPARALSAVVMALACALLVPIGRRLFSLRVGIVAAVAASLTPHLIAHGKVVGHEAPSVLWWTLAVWLCLRAHDGAGDARALARRFAVIGVVLGVALFSRFSNGLLAPLIGALLLLHAPREQLRRTAVLGFAVIPVVALAVGFVIWPRLWVTPIEHTKEAWAILEQLHGAEPYLGAIVGTERHPAPWHYFFVYFAATAPVGVIAAAVPALARYKQWRSAGTLLLWLLAPMLVLLSPVKQDGVRYILPALAALSLAAAAGLDVVAERFGHRHALAAMGAALAAYLVVVDARIHPYYLDYYGEHVGGSARVSRNKQFELAWWGEGVDRGIAYLNEHAEPGAIVDKRRLQPGHLTWMRADLWKQSVGAGPWPSPRADWVLVNDLSVRPFDPPPESGLQLVYEVDAQGAPLVRVYRRAD